MNESILQFRKIFSTEIDIVINTTHLSSPELDRVPLADLPSHLTAAGGEHATAAVGVVF